MHVFIATKWTTLFIYVRPIVSNRVIIYTDEKLIFLKGLGT